VRRARIMLAKLNLQGFALIETYHGPIRRGCVIVNPGEDEYRCTIVEDFRERDTNFKRDQGRGVCTSACCVDARARAARGGSQDARILYTDGRDQYRREFRNRVQVGKGARRRG
jgi:hypothetical protein